MRKVLDQKPQIIFYIALSVLIVFFMPYLLLGKGSYLNPIDNLDSNLVWYKVLVDHGAQFWPNDRLIDGMIGLQPRHVYPSEFDPILWMYTILPTYWAYAFNFIGVHCVAFFSMYVLLHKHIVVAGATPMQKTLYAGGGALLFALIPFWVHAGISAAGIPLLVLSVIQMEKGHWQKGLLLSLSYVLYSSLVMSGIFVLALYLFYLVLGFVFRHIKLKKKKLHLINMALMSLTYVITNYRLMWAVLFSDFESHRIQTAALDTERLEWAGLFDFPFRAFVIDGQWHAGAMFVLIPLGALILLTWFLLKNQKSQITRHIGLAMLSLLGLLYFFSNGLINQLISAIPVLGALQWERFYLLLPFGLTLTFVALFYVLIPVGKWKNLGFTLCVLVSVAFYFTKDYNWNNSLKLLLGKTPHGETYAEYYRLDEYPKVKAALEEQGYSRVVSLGIDPAIAVYHGIRSADGYLANYQLSSKQQMRKVIAGELDKSPELKGYFDGWGSRCYLFHSEIGKKLNNNNPMPLQRLAFNFGTLNKMQISHILSPYQIAPQDKVGRRLQTNTFQQVDQFFYIQLSSE